MKPLEKISEEQAICKLLLSKRTKEQDKECLKLIIDYQIKYKHPFPISVIDKYMEQNNERTNESR